MISSNRTAPEPWFRPYKGAEPGSAIGSSLLSEEQQRQVAAASMHGAAPTRAELSDAVTSVLAEIEARAPSPAPPSAAPWFQPRSNIDKFAARLAMQGHPIMSAVVAAGARGVEGVKGVFRGDPQPLLDIVDNMQYGLRNGSLLLPDDETAPENPDKFLQGSGFATGLLGESIIPELGIAGVVGRMARAGNQAPRIASIGQAALRLLGQGPRQGAVARTAGGVGLGVGVEAATQAAAVGYGDRTLEEAKDSLRWTTLIGGGLVGAAGVGKTVASRVRPLTRTVSGMPASERVRGLVNFEKEARAFPGSGTGPDDPSYTFADDLRVFQAEAGRALTRALQETRSVLMPMARTLGYVSPQEYGDFRRVGLMWMGAKRLSALGDPTAAVRMNDFLTERARMSVGAREALDHHIDRVEWAFNIENVTGELGTASAFYRRRLADLPPTAAEYGTQMAKVQYHYNMQNARNELVRAAIASNGRRLGALPSAEQATLLNGGTVSIDGVSHRLADPFNWDTPSKTILENAMGGSVEAYALPSTLLRRLEQQGVANEMPAWVRGTGAWKSSIVFWGLAEFATRNVLSDFLAGVRSFPGLFATPTGWRSLHKAARVQANRYKMPWYSPEQALGVLAGTAASTFGAAVDGELEVSDAAMIAGGALAGYGAGTYWRRAAERASLDASRLANQPPSASLTRVDRGLVHLYERAADLGVVGSDIMTQEIHLGRALDSLPPTSPVTAQGAASSTMKALQSLWLGQSVSGAPRVTRELLGTLGTVAEERENFFRLAAFFHQMERGVPEKVAARRAREAFVDYGRFTDFENKYLRGFLLPFYSFVRHSVPNWTNRTVRDVVKDRRWEVAAGAATVAAFHVAWQDWNERFFPEIEAGLGPDERERFHIIMGNPTTGEPFKDDNGRVLIAGMQTPVDQVFELFTGGSLSTIYSETMGLGVDGSSSLFARWQRQEDFSLASEATKTVFGEAAAQFRRLLNPVAGAAYGATTGESLAFGSPLVQPWRDEAEHVQWLRWWGKTVAPIYATYEKWQREDYDPLTSPVGFGVPIAGVDRNRALRQRILAMLQFAEDGRQDPAVRTILELIGRRDDVEIPAPLEAEELERLRSSSESYRDAERLLRTYGRVTSRGTLVMKQWDAMELDARERFLRAANEADRAAFLFFFYGGDKFFLDDEVESPLGSFAP